MIKEYRKFGVIMAFIMIFQIMLSVFAPMNVNASTTMDSIIEDIGVLEEFAANYIQETSDGSSVNKLVLGYISNNGYNDIWTSNGNPYNTAFADYVNDNSEKDLTYLKNVVNVNDVDFHLLINSINVLSNKTSNYCNWGYLLVTAAIAHGASNDDVDNIMSKLSFTNDTAKLNAVFDAVNISNNIYSNSISQALDNYYDKVNTSSRFRNFTSFMFPTSKVSKDNLREIVFNKFSSDTTIVSVLGNNNISLSNSEYLLRAVSYKFADYIFEKHPDRVVEQEIIKPSELVIEAVPDKLQVGDKFDLGVVVLPEVATNQNYTITSSDEKIIKVENNTLTCVGPGVVTIKVSLEDIENSFELTVYGKASAIISNQTKYNLNVGEEVTLSYEFDTPSLDEIVWETTSSVVSVDNNGTVKALTAGEAKVFCKLKTDETIYLVYNFTVKSPIEGISISNKKNNDKYASILVFSVRDTYLLEVDVNPVSQKNHLVYESSNEKVCTVTKGVLKAVSAGEATIKVYSDIDKDKFDTVKVIVLPGVESVKFSQSEIYINMSIEENKTTTVEAIFGPEDYDKNSIDYRVYKVEKDKEVREFGALTYDWVTGELKITKKGTYKVSIINKDSFEEIGYFFVTGEFAGVENEETSEEESLVKDTEPLFKLKPETLKTIKYGLIAFIVLIIVSLIVGIVLYIKGDDDKGSDFDDMDDEELLDELEERPKKTVSTNETKSILSETKVLPNINTSTTEKVNEDEELNDIIANISKNINAKNSVDLFVDNVNIETYIEDYRVDLSGIDLDIELKDDKKKENIVSDNKETQTENSADENKDSKENK